MNFFITKNFDKKIDKKSNIILSPEFYWIKKVSLDVRFASEVKSMAESIFDGILPRGDFEYKVFKLSRREYIIVAYDIKSIKTELKNLDIATNFINKIYLAQSEFSYEELSILTEDGFGITSSKGVVLYVPKELLEKSVDMKEVLIDKKLSSKYIYSSKFSGAKFYDKWLNLFLLISVLCSFIFLTDIFRLKQSIESLQKTKSDILSKNSLPKSSFELKSLLKESVGYEKSKANIKSSLDYISRFPLKRGEFFTSLRLQKGRMVCMLELKSIKRKELFKRYISKNRKSTIKIELSK